MNEMKSLTLNGKTYDSFVDQTAREGLEHKQPKGDYVTMEEVEELLGIEEEFSVTGEVVEFDVDVEPGTDLAVISKIHRDETWGLSDKLVLHQVSGINFVDFTSYLGGVGTVIEKSGLTATINADSTITVSGTNESADYNFIINQYHFSGEHSEKVYPAGTYTIPKGFMMNVRSAQYPTNANAPGVTGNLSNTVTIPEPFRIIAMVYAVKPSETVNVTLPLGLFRGNSIPETGYEYSGVLHTVTFDSPIYDGEFNWSTGELKDAGGNTVGYYDTPEIKRLPGTNYFWTCWGENTVSNVSNDLGKVLIQLGESAPEEAVPSICDFTLIPKTKDFGMNLYGDDSKLFNSDGPFNGIEVPLITTRGKIVCRNSEGEVEYTADVPELINSKSITDVMNGDKITKRWSERFYITRDPDIIETVDDGSGATTTNPNAVATWIFPESDFELLGLPVESTEIPIVSPYFTSVTTSKLETQKLSYSEPYFAVFGFDADLKSYVFKCRARSFYSKALYQHTNAYFCYRLKEDRVRTDAMLSLYLEKGYAINFEQDGGDFDAIWEYAKTKDWPPIFTESGSYLWKSNTKPTTEEEFEQVRDTTPSVQIEIPRSIDDAIRDSLHIAKRLNAPKDNQGNREEVNSYGWIGAGDGVTDYTEKIQSKLTELHNTTNGGTIYLGPGTYPISKSLIVYGNTQIIGDGHTIIEQIADNTHAVIWSGSNIRMCDLTIKLAGACTELTGCIFVNSLNTANTNRDERYPENMYAQYCSTSNVTIVGTYGFSWEDGYPYLSDEALAYRGVGVCCDRSYFNFYDCAGLNCKNLYAGIYGGGGGSNNYRICVTESRYAVYGGGGNNIYDINGHTLYGHNRDGQSISASEYVFYGKYAEANDIAICFYDTQYLKGLVYFDGKCKSNRYTGAAPNSSLSNGASTYWESGYTVATDYGRGNAAIQPYPEKFVGVGSHLYGISGLQIWNTQFNPSVNNALSGAGVWGAVTSNKEWTSNGIGLSDVCRYPKDTLKTYFGLASTICEASPSEESPIEIIIDISDRPVTNYKGFWIQFDHRYVAEKYTVSFDTNNDGVFNWVAITQAGNNEPISYGFNYQEPSLTVYRIKISITKALQIPDFTYMNDNYGATTIDYNPDGLIGIVNIGMPSNEAYGRAFLGECGGNMYGNVDMHRNALKNLPDPVDAGDAVSMAYLERRLAQLEALINGT